MSDKTLLSTSQVCYLLALKRLNYIKGIKGSDIAEELNLSRPSVHYMMNVFVSLKYIEKRQGGRIFLTEYGLQRAKVFEEQYYKIKRKLFSENETDKSVDRAICAMIAELSEK